MLIDDVPIPALTFHVPGKVPVDTLATEKPLGNSNLRHLILLPFEGTVAVNFVVTDPLQNDPAMVTGSASVNTHSACNPLLCPSAVNFNVAPNSSASPGTSQVELTFPFASATTVHG